MEQSLLSSAALQTQITELEGKATANADRIADLKSKIAPSRQPMVVLTLDAPAEHESVPLLDAQQFNLRGLERDLALEFNVKDVLAERLSAARAQLQDARLKESLAEYLKRAAQREQDIAGVIEVVDQLFQLSYGVLISDERSAVLREECGTMVDPLPRAHWNVLPFFWAAMTLIDVQLKFLAEGHPDLTLAEQALRVRLSERQRLGQPLLERLIASSQVTA